MDTTAKTITRCGCGSAYSLDEWRGLRYVGRIPDPDPGVYLELRDCTCRSTLGLWVDDGGHPVTPTDCLPAGPATELVDATLAALRPYCPCGYGACDGNHDPSAVNDRERERYWDQKISGRKEGD